MKQSRPTKGMATAGPNSQNSPQHKTDVAIHNSQRDVHIPVKKIKAAVLFLLQKFDVFTDEISLHFVTERKIIELHRTFFDDPTVTDCITFPIDSPIRKRKNSDYHVLGEIFICPKVALEYAKKHHIAVQKELFRYVVHGFLHLIGYDDIAPADRIKMKRKENACLKELIDDTSSATL